MSLQGPLEVSVDLTSNHVSFFTALWRFLMKRDTFDRTTWLSSVWLKRVSNCKIAELRMLEVVGTALHGQCGRAKLLKWILSGVNNFFLRFEVLTAIVMKSSIFWDITPCSPLKVNRSFRGKCRFHFQNRSQARNERERRWKIELLCWFLAWFILRPWRWRRLFPPKRRLSFNGLHGVVSQKIKLFRYVIIWILGSHSSNAV
jgi:hypothetical protein